MLRHSTDNLALAGAAVERGWALSRPLIQCLAYVVDDELPVIAVHRLPATGRHHLAKQKTDRLRPAPVQSIVYQILALGLEMIVRTPERDDVIVYFLRTWDLHQLHDPFAPVA